MPVTKIPVVAGQVGIGALHYEPSDGSLWRQTTALVTPDGFTEIDTGGGSGAEELGDLSDIGATGILLGQADSQADALTALGATGAGATAIREALDVEDGGFGGTDSAPEDGTVTVMAYIPFACTITSATVETESGTVSCAFKLGSTTITGLSAVTASSTPNTDTASAANVAAAGDRLRITFSSASSPVNFAWSIAFVKTA